MIGLGSTSQLGIGIAVRLHDQFSNQAKQINQQLLAMRKNSQSALSGAMTSYRNQSLLIAGGAAAVSVGMFNMVKAASEYEHIINKVAIIGGPALGKTRKELDAFAQSMNKIFPGSSPKDIASLMGENVRAGITSGLEEITKYQLAVATATDESATTVGMGMIGMMNAFDLVPTKMYNVQGKVVSGMNLIANGIAQAANLSMASVSDISESMQYFAPIAHQAGMTFEQSLAIISKLGNTSILGSKAGVWSANAVQHLINNVGMFMGKKDQKAWAALGLDPNAMVEAINSGKVYEAFSLIDKAASKLQRQPKGALLNALFGERGGKAVINAFTGENGYQGTEQLRQGIIGGIQTDIVMKQAKAMSQDVWTDIKRVGGAIARFGIQFLNAAKPVLRVFFGLVEKVISFGEFLLSTSVGKVLAGIVAVSVPLIGVLFAFRAAALTATIALRGFAASSAIGGFGGLIRGGMGMIGMSRFGAAGGAMAKNAAGRWTVAAGQTISHAGKTYKGGQLLPAAYLATMGLGRGAAAGAATGTMARGFMGKVLGWGGRALGMFGRFLPVVGGVFLAVDLLKGILSLTAKKEVERKKLDPVFMNYYRHLDEQLFGMGNTHKFYNDYDMSRGQFNERQNSPQFNQQLNINLDGTPVFNKMLQMQAETSLNNNLNFELPEF